VETAERGQPKGIGTDPYEKAWKSLRERRLLRLIAVATFLPAIFLAKLVLGPGVVAVLFIHFALVVIATVRAAYFRCPRCQDLFAAPGFFTTPRWGSVPKDTFSRTHCKHCGLGPVVGGLNPP
jgi:hypothetical protein